MKITAALAAELALLSETLGDSDVHPTPDFVDTVRQLASNARAAVTSYLGLSVLVTAWKPEFRFTVLDDGVDASDILTSLELPLPALAAGSDWPSIAVILYAAMPGAFVDLAADAGFLTGRALSEVELDQHLSVATEVDTTGALRAASTINEAIGVLIARGRTPEQATRELDAHAITVGADRNAAAAVVLAGLTVIGSNLEAPTPGANGHPSFEHHT